VGVECMRRLQPEQLEFARALRSNLTEAERMLWQRLRQRQVDGRRFRRQHPIGPYVADFACIEARVVVELDGGQHAGSERDAERDAAMQVWGWRVLRLWNNEVMANMDGVLTTIAAAITEPPPRPSPCNGEGGK
jgi:very-short-patch-repair endonuclease